MLQFRLLDDNDLLLVETWLNKEHVKRWYEIPRLGVSIEDWMYEIKERNGEFKWLTYLMVLYDGRPIGLCQYYKCEDSLDEAFGTLPLKGSYGIDYLIGEEAYIGKGLGKAMIALLVDKIFSFPDARELPPTSTKITRPPKRHCYPAALLYWTPGTAVIFLTKTTNKIMLTVCRIISPTRFAGFTLKSRRLLMCNMISGNMKGADETAPFLFAGLSIAHIFVCF